LIARLSRHLLLLLGDDVGHGRLPGCDVARLGEARRGLLALAFDAREREFVG
jgi:hypothetical protein